VLTTKDVGGFPELMSVMVMLAGTWHGSGHVILFRAVVEWLAMCKKELASSDGKPVTDSSEKEINGSANDAVQRRQSLLDVTCCLLSYISDVLTALKHVASDGRPVDFGVTSDIDTQMADVADSDGADELVQDDDDSAAEDSVCCLYNNSLFCLLRTQEQLA